MLANDPKTALAWLHEKLGVSGDGHPANRPDLHGDLPRLAPIMGEALAAVHALDVADSPLAIGWDVIDDAITSRLSAGSIAPRDLGKPYDLYEAGRLVEIWQSGRPADEDLVVSCGQPTLENTLIMDSKLAGFASANHGAIVDRHLDLAIAQQSIHAELGSEAVFSFYEGYGKDASIVKLDHYVLASRLLGIVQ